MILKVGLTGGIGSGKSTVANIFKVLGIPVFDSDAAAKEVMHTDKALQQAIMRTFGEDVYQQGELNRKLLASMVFTDPFRLEQLNALVHPATIAVSDAWMDSQRTPYAIKEAALLFEAGSAGHLDYIIGVSAPRALRIQRVMQRDNAGRQDVLTRMSRQIEEDIKMRLCDFVIFNNDQEMLIPQVLKVHEQLLDRARQMQTAIISK